MKKKFLINFLFILFASTLQGQNNEETKYSFSFENKAIKECFKEIENKTQNRFYFNEKWTDLNKKINLSFNEVNLETILNDIIKDTNLNFFKDDNKFIITQSNFIYTDINTNLIVKDSVINENKTSPLFFEKIIDNQDTESESITIIGKQDGVNHKKTHVLDGIIIDTKTNNPISGVVINVTNRNKKTETDIDGYFKIELPDGLNVIEIISMSYKKINQKIILKKDATLNYQLTENITLLNEVVVQKEKNKEVKTVASGVTTFNVEKAKNVPLVLGERDIIKLALSLPGIKAASEGSSGINVRGGKDDQNLFLLDNATIYNPSHFFGFFSSVNPYLVNEVNIYKGHIPAEFGGRIASVFEINSKEGNYEKFKGEGGIGPVTSNITFTTPIVKGKSTLIAGARATYSKWILKQIDNENLQKSDASFYDIYLKYKHKINENNAIETSAYYSKDNFNISSDSLYSYSNSAFSLNWKHNFNKKNISNFQLINSNYAFGIDYVADNLKSFNYDFNINETKFIFKNVYFYNEKHKFSYGLNATLYQLNPGELKPIDDNSLLTYRKINNEKGLESALFINDEYTLNKKLSFNLGLRYSSFLAMGPSSQTIYRDGAPTTSGNIEEIRTYKNNEAIKNYNGLEYRFGSRYMFNETFSVKLAYTTNYQYLHKLSSNTTQSPTDTWKLADLNIKPAFGQQMSLGFFKSLKDDLYQISLEGYYKKTENFLDFKVGSDLLLSESIERDAIQGKGKAYGVEFLIKKSEGRLNGWIGYTYSRSLIQLNGNTPDKVVNNGNYFASNFDKPHDFNTILNYKFTKRYSASFNFTYQTGRPVTYPVGTYTYGNAQYTLYSDRNKFRIPDYYRVDIGINIEGNHKIKKPYHSFWNISVYNLLGRNNPHSIFFVTENGQIKAYKTSIFSYPIPTITYNFKF
ncbi:TonB-dependent receptor [Flavobacterium sp.]|uniref:TonB-dependent receptor n=1 Tax=Flavobacterium sp. TaxID=239 RepID=UPI004048937E